MSRLPAYTPPVGSPRRSPLVRSLPLLAMLAALGLVVSQALAWWGVQRAAKTANRGEADILVGLLESQLRRRPPGPVDPHDLEEFLARHEERGLRYVAVDEPGGRVERGVGLLDDPGPPHRFVVESDRVRGTLVRRPPPGGPPPGMHRDGPPPPVVLIVELTPTLGPQLLADAWRTLAASVVTAFLFVLLALALRRALRDRERALEREERARRLATIGEMSAVLAHEIRNPLASLKGHAQLLAESLDDDADHRKASLVVREAERLEALTNGLLEFVRSGEVERALVDFAELVRGAVAAVPGDFATMLPAEPIRGLADGPRLHQALVNLLANATQASDAEAEVELRRSGSSVEILVRDRGPGVPADEAETIFEPFHTTRVRGTGLGLPLARRIAEGHGGTVDFANREGGGACFRLTLPLREKD